MDLYDLAWHHGKEAFKAMVRVWVEVSNKFQVEHDLGDGDQTVDGYLKLNASGVLEDARMIAVDGEVYEFFHYQPYGQDWEDEFFRWLSPMGLGFEYHEYSLLVITINDREAFQTYLTNPDAVTLPRPERPEESAHKRTVLAAWLKAEGIEVE